MIIIIIFALIVVGQRSVWLVGEDHSKLDKCNPNVCKSESCMDKNGCRITSYQPILATLQPLNPILFTEFYRSKVCSSHIHLFREGEKYVEYSVNQNVIQNTCSSNVEEIPLESPILYALATGLVALSTGIQNQLNVKVERYSSDINRFKTSSVLALDYYLSNQDKYNPNNEYPQYPECPELKFRDNISISNFPNYISDFHRIIHWNAKLVLAYIKKESGIRKCDIKNQKSIFYRIFRYFWPSFRMKQCSLLKKLENQLNIFDGPSFHDYKLIYQSEIIDIIFRLLTDLRNIESSKNIIKADQTFKNSPKRPFVIINGYSHIKNLGSILSHETKLDVFSFPLGYINNNYRDFWVLSRMRRYVKQNKELK